MTHQPRRSRSDRLTTPRERGHGPWRARLGVEGLEDRLAPSATPPLVHLHHVVHHASGTASPQGSVGPIGYQPAQIRQAYAIDQVTFSNGAVQGDGTGQTIAIVDAYGNPNAAQDLKTFDSQTGLPDPPGFTVV